MIYHDRKKSHKGVLQVLAIWIGWANTHMFSIQDIVKTLHMLRKEAEQYINQVVMAGKSATRESTSSSMRQIRLHQNTDVSG